MVSATADPSPQTADGTASGERNGRDLVMGFCANYPFEKVEPFVASFFNSGIDADLCLFVSNMDSRFHEVAASRGIRLEDAAPYFALRFHPQNGRFFMYQDYLKKHASKYRKIMLADIRDAFFQGNPFDVLFPAPVCFAQEDTWLHVGSMNMQWLQDIYGDALAAELTERPVTCSGTTLGESAAMRTYVDLMCAEIDGHDYDHVHPNDQGMHNYIVWKLRPKWGMLDTQDRVFKTVGCTSSERITIENGRVLVDGLAAPVIHQWDRQPVLMQHVATDPRFRISP